MTDRTIVYTAEEPIEADILNTSKFPMVGIAKLAEALLGQSTQLYGLGCSPFIGGGMKVTIAPGQIYKYVATDSSSYGALPADSRQVLKQGLLQDSTDLLTPAPANPGMSVNYLIEVTLQEEDTQSATRDFLAVDSNNVPTGVVYQTTVNGVRKCNCIVTAKAGVQAPTGTQVTPAPDSGYVGAWVVVTNYGDTNITSGDISLYPGAPFISNTVGDFVTKVYADATYATITYVNNAIAGLAIPTGFRMAGEYHNYAPPVGWIPDMMGTIGNASSGASVRANADCLALYTLWWTNLPYDPVVGGRGASALVDFNANKKLNIPTSSDRVIGNGTPNQAMGSLVGNSTAALNLNNNGPHPHTYDKVNYITRGIGGGGDTAYAAGTVVNNTSTSGSGLPFSIVQPTYYTNVFIKL